MLKRFLLKMVLSLIFLMLFSLKFVDVTIGEQIHEYPLEMAWQATGLILGEVSTETWLRVNNHWMSSYDLKAAASDIQRQFGLHLRTKLISGEQSDFNYVSFEGLQSDGTVFTVTLQSTRSGQNYETQMGINTCKSGNLNNLRNYVEALHNKISRLGSQPNFSVSFTGQYNGVLSSTFIRELSGRALRKVQAELVSSAIQNGNSSQKGYSRLIPEAGEYNSKPVNIEISTRYDKSRGITQVIMATPYLVEGE